MAYYKNKRGSSKTTRSKSNGGSGKSKSSSSIQSKTVAKKKKPKYNPGKNNTAQQNKDNAIAFGMTFDKMTGKGIKSSKKWKKEYQKNKEEIAGQSKLKVNVLGLISDLFKVTPKHNASVVPKQISNNKKSIYGSTNEKVIKQIAINNKPKKSSTNKKVTKQISRKHVKYKFEKTWLDSVRENRSNKPISKISNFVATGIMLIIRDKSMPRKQQNYLRSGLALLISEGINYALREPLGVIEKVKRFYTVGKVVYKCVVWINEEINFYSFDYEESVATHDDLIEYEKFRKNYNVKLDNYFDYSIDIEIPITVKLNEPNTLDEQYEYSVIACKFNNQWLFCKNKSKSTYEIPGGKREVNESIDACAERELMEETGAIDFQLYKICNYSVTKNNKKDYGMLYFADIKSKGELIHEIKEIIVSNDLPDNLTYKEIQTVLFNKAKEYEQSVEQIDS